LLAADEIVDQFIFDKAKNIGLGDGLIGVAVAKDQEEVNSSLSDLGIGVEQHGQHIVDQVIVDDALRLLQVLEGEQVGLQNKSQLEQLGEGAEEGDDHNFLRVMDQGHVGIEDEHRQVLLAHLDSHPNDSLQEGQFDHEVARNVDSQQKKRGDPLKSHLSAIEITEFA
jgi:hypothetical protein